MRREQRSGQGQALTEFALVFPLFIMLFFAVIVYGLGQFYQQQVQNAAREAARFAAIHSSEAQCPTVSNLPLAGPPPFSFYNCDTPAAGWPAMTGFARNSIWGVDPAQVKVSACWSSYQDPGDPTKYDLPAVDPTAGTPNSFVRCTYARVQDDPSGIACPSAATTGADDKGFGRAWESSHGVRMFCVATANGRVSRDPEPDHDASRRYGNRS